MNSQNLDSESQTAIDHRNRKCLFFYIMVINIALFIFFFLIFLSGAAYPQNLTQHTNNLPFCVMDIANNLHFNISCLSIANK